MHGQTYIRVYNSLILVPVLNLIYPVYSIPDCFFKIHFTIMFPSTPRSCERFSLRLPRRTLCTFMFSPHVPHAQQISSWFDHPNNIWWGRRNTKLTIFHFSPLPCYLLSVGSSIFHHTLFSNTLILSSMYYPAHALCDTHFMTYQLVHVSAPCCPPQGVILTKVRQPTC